MSDTSSSGRVARPRLVTTETRGPRLAIGQSTTPYWSLRQDVVGCQEVGIDALGLVREKLEHPSATTGLTTLFESNVEVSSLTWIEGFTGADGRTFDDALEDGLEAVKLAGLIGARTLVVDTGGRNGHILSHARRILDEGLSILADEAEHYDVRLGLRPLDPAYGGARSFLGTVASALEIVEHHDRPTIGLVLDARQLWFERQLVDRILDWASRTFLVQLSDWRRRPRPERDCVQLGDGSLPLERLLRRLHEVGYDGDCEITLASAELAERNYIEVMMEARHRYETLAGLPAPVEIP